MIKKITYGSIVFIVSFIIFTWLMLPYEQFAESMISRAIADSGANISYSELKSGPFSTKISGIEAETMPIGDVTLSYSPLSMITRSAGLKFEGSINGEGKISSKELNFLTTINPSLVNSQIELAELEGELRVEGRVPFQGEPALFAANSDKITVTTPLGPLAFEKVSSIVSVKGSNIDLKSLKSDDSMKLNLKGAVRLNKRNIDRSSANISGTFSLMGSEKKLTLVGRLSNLKPSIR